MSFIGWLGILILGSVLVYLMIEAKDWFDK